MRILVDVSEVYHQVFCLDNVFSQDLVAFHRGRTCPFTTHQADAKYACTANLRLFESFSATVGDRFGAMLQGKGIGPVLKGYHVDLKRPTAYPDAVLVASRLSDARPDRYLITTTIWSIRQRAIVAECTGWVVFVDFSTGRPANLVNAGEPYASLHAQMKEKADKSNALRVEWIRNNPTGRPQSKL